MTVQHIADPARGAQEAAINAGLARDGVGQRICLHADQTLRQGESTDWDLVLECDYCPSAGLAILGAMTELPAWYWSTKELT